MDILSDVKSLYKGSQYQKVVNLLETDSNKALENREILELSMIYYYYVRSLLELGIIDKALTLAQNRYLDKKITSQPDARLFTIITYAYALMNKGLYQNMTNLEVEGNAICENLGESTNVKLETLESITLFKNVIGNAFLLISNLEKALNYYHQSLKIREKIGNKTFIADCLLNIGLVYFNQGNYEKTYEYESKALHYYQDAGEKFGILNTSVNIVILKINQGKWNEATELIQEAMQLAISLDNLKFQSILLQMQGDIFENKGNLDDAILYYNQSLSIKEQLGNEKFLADILVSIGHVHIEKKEYQQALDCFNKSNDYYFKSGSKFHIINSTFWIFWIHYTLKNKDKITEYASIIFKSVENYHDLRTKQIFDLTTSLYASTSNNSFLDDKTALNIQDMLLKTDFIDLKLQLIATNMLCIYKLNKLKKSDTEKLREEISSIIDNINKLGVEKNSYKFMVNGYILKAKYNLVLGNIDVTLESINQASKIAREYELERYLDLIELEEKDLANKIDMWYNNIPINPPMNEKIDDSNILTYLKDIMNLL